MLIYKLLFSLLFCTVFAAHVHADIYKYVDPKGKLIITDKQLGQPYRLLKRFNSQTQALRKINNPSAAYQRKVRQYIPHIRRAARKHQLDPDLIHAIIDTESAFNPKAISRTGAIGLMQLMPRTAKSLGVRNSWIPRQNIYGGSKYFRQLLDIFNQDIKLSLAAYNAGPSAVKRAGYAIPNYPETQRYVKKVLKRYRELKGIT